MHIKIPRLMILNILINYYIALFIIGFHFIQFKEMINDRRFFTIERILIDEIQNSKFAIIERISNNFFVHEFDGIIAKQKINSV